MFGIEAKPGFNKTILPSIKSIASKLKLNDKKCIISFDEMKLKPGLSYNKKHDTVVGYDDFGSFAVSDPKLAAHALVLWCVDCVRNGNWCLGTSSPANMLHQPHCTTFCMRGLKNLSHVV